jgi:NifB/MoaA-like Fe-S oxidoreductase
MNLNEVIATIVKLEHEREEIYADSVVTPAENPRLHEIERELTRLWDLRRRIEAARAAGQDEPVVPPPPDPENLIG